MGKNQNSVVVLQIRLKFWWMIPVGVKYNHTKFEEETQRWRPGTRFASGGSQFQKLQFRAKNSHFWAQNALPSESHFEPCSQRYGLFLVCGCWHLELVGAFLGRFRIISWS